MSGKLNMRLTDFVCTCKTEILPLIVEHLLTLEKKMNFYFPSLNTAQQNLFLKSTIEYT